MTHLLETSNLTKTFGGVHAVADLSFGVEAGAIREGYEGDIALVDPEKPWVVDRRKMAATADNTPFDGQPMQGRVLCLWKGGVRVD